MKQIPRNRCLSEPETDLFSAKQENKLFRPIVFYKPPEAIGVKMKQNLALFWIGRYHESNDLQSTTSIGNAEFGGTLADMALPFRAKLL